MAEEAELQKTAVAGEVAVQETVDTDGQDQIGEATMVPLTENPFQISDGVYDNIQEASHLIQNGLRLQLRENSLPFAAYTYGTIPASVVTELDWTIIVSEDVTASGDHVHCHQLKMGESLNEVLAEYLCSEAVAVVLINNENNYNIVHEVQGQVCLPVLVLSSEDGLKLMQELQNAEDNSVFAAIKLESSDRIDLEASNKAESSSSLQTPSLQSLPSLPPSLGARLKKKSDINRILEQSLYEKRGVPVCVSANVDLFKQLMGDFKQYEKLNQGRQEKHINSTLIKFLVTHRDQTFATDFPFYLLLAFKMHTCKSRGSLYYYCEELQGFVYGCIEMFESLPMKQLAETLNEFIERGDFLVRVFHAQKTEEISVCEQLEKAAIHLMAESSNRKSEAKGEERFFYHKYVYCRMLWISLAMKCHMARYGSAPVDYWTDSFVEACKHMRLNSDTIAEIAKGLKMGNLLRLPFDATFNPPSMAKLLTAPTTVHSFSHLRAFLEAIVPEICLEANLASQVMITFLRQLYMHYHKWISSRKPRKQKLESLHVLGGEEGVLDDGLKFTDSVLRMWRERGWDIYKESLDDHLIQWLSMLLQVIDFTAKNAAQCLQRFTSQRFIEAGQKPLTTKEYRKAIPKLIVTETRKQLTTMNVEHFFSLYKALMIWKRENVEEFLMHSLPKSGKSTKPQMKIIDSPWPECFCEVTLRHSGASDHDFLITIMQKFSEVYLNENIPAEFIVHLLKLNVPKLFAETPGKRVSTSQYVSPDEVQTKFTSFLKDYVYRSHSVEQLVAQFASIMESVSENPDEHIFFHQLVLSVVKEVITPDVQSLSGSLDNSCRCAVNKAIDYIVENFKWESQLSLRHQLCWYMVNASCDQICPAKAEIYKYTDVTCNLSKIYKHYCLDQNLVAEDCFMSGDLPENVRNVPQVEQYFQWIFKLQQWAVSWKQKVDQKTVTYSEICTLMSNFKQFKSLVEATCLTSAVVNLSTLKEAYENFGSSFDLLNCHLLKYIPDLPGLKWVALTSVFGDYGVKFPTKVVELISKYIVFPGDYPGGAGVEILEQPIHIPLGRKFRPGYDISLDVSRSLTLEDLSVLVKELDEFLLPVNPYLNMLVFFKLQQSVLFPMYLRCRLNVQNETNEEASQSHPMYNFPHLPRMKLNGVKEESSADDFETFKSALQTTEQFLVHFVEGKATCREITACGKLDLEDPQLLVTHELVILAEFVPLLQKKYPYLPAAEDAGFQTIKYMVELFSLKQYIESIENALQQYQMHGCLHDPNFSKLMGIKNILSSESQKAELTPLEATAKLTEVKHILHLDEKAQYTLTLDLFPVISESAILYQFLEEKQFIGDQGQEKFSSEYELVTAQLQHEEYDEIVLNELRGAFRFIKPFTLKDQTLEQLMLKVLEYDAATAIRQLKTVNMNITLIRIWFSRTEGETMKNVAHKLKCITESGYYQFNLNPRKVRSGEEVELVYLHLSDSFCEKQETALHDAHEVTSRQPLGVPAIPARSKKMPEAQCQRWKREDIDDFVRKLGFLDSEVADREEINSFLHQNEMVQKFLHCFMTLRELGHPSYSSPWWADSSPFVSTENLDSPLDVHSLTCENVAELETCDVKYLCCKVGVDTSKKLEIIEQELNDWRRKLAVLHAEYAWLLFLSVPKVLKIYGLLVLKKPSAFQITSEIRFLFSSNPTAMEAVQNAIEEILPDSLQKRSCDEGAVHAVGHFLKLLQERVEDYMLPFSACIKPSEYTLMLHFGPNYNQTKLIQMIVGIYNGIPQPFEVFHCFAETSEEELNLFMKRAAKHPHHYLLLEVNNLPFKLQEYLLLRSIEAQQECTEFGEKAVLHFIESSASLLQEMHVPWFHISKEEETGPLMDLEEARLICHNHISRSSKFSAVEVVYGYAGDGKTFYIKEQLKKAPKSLTIAINEAFSVANAVRRLQSLSTHVKGCALYFNFTLLPPGGQVDKSEVERYQCLLETVGWFFFNLLLLGYVEDRISGASFCIPAGLEWSVYAEVPIRQLEMKPECALEQFTNEFPTLGLLGRPHFVKPSIPFALDSEVQLVCKYLKAYDDTDRNGKRRIDRLYPKDETLQFQRYKPKPVKFSMDSDLSVQDCQNILSCHMDERMKKNKLMQKMFIRYMYRRCSFLDNLPAFNFNNGAGDWQRAGKSTDTTKLGSTLMNAILQEVKNICDPTANQNWAHKTHQQLIYDYKDGGASVGLISLQPDKMPQAVKESLVTLGINIPTLSKIHDREYLDLLLSRALNVPLSKEGRLSAIDESDYVLTLDYAIKMLNIHERLQCRVPVIIEGESGVGKTALVEMLRKLWNQSLLTQWDVQLDRILYDMKLQLGRLPVNAIPELMYGQSTEAVQKLSALEPAEEIDLVQLGRTPDLITPHPGHCFCSVLRRKLLSLREDPIIPLLTESKKIQEFFAEIEKEDSPPQVVAKLLKTLFGAKMKHLFYKLNIHSGLIPADVQEQFEPILREANDLQEAIVSCGSSGRVTSLGLPTVTVFLDEVNTSSCLGLFKEIIIDRSLDGEPLPDNIFIVASCNPHRGDSLAVHIKSAEMWLSPTHYVRQLHPTLEFLKWDYGSLDKSREHEYIQAKLKMIEKEMNGSEVSCLTELIVESHEQMHNYALDQLRRCKIPDAEKCSKCCVSQRDIQRVFTFFSKLKSIYEACKPHAENQDNNRHAIVVSLGIVYYMRLSTIYRRQYEEFLNSKHLLGRQVSFSVAFNEDLDWFAKQISLPPGIAKTQALKENLFAIIMCTMTHTPLIITGAPGSSKTLSFNLVIANLRGQESKNEYFRNTDLFPSLDPRFYQCSRRTTSSEIEKLFIQAVNRQRSHSLAQLPICCVVFLDEAGLPQPKHEALKVLHSHLDQQEVSFVAITNNILDAAKANRAVSLFRQENSSDDLEVLAKGCLCPTPDSPPKELKDDVERVVNFCSAYLETMSDHRFKDFFGLRDFIHFVNFLRRKRGKAGSLLTDRRVLQALERNFNGLEDCGTIWNRFLSKIGSSLEGMVQRSVLDVLDESLRDHPHVMGAENEVRYKLIIDPSEDDSLVRLLFMFDVLERDKTYLYMCSDFPSDGQSQKVNTIAAIRHSAVQGHTVILSQTDDIHESFYDLFNERFRRIDHEDGPRYFTNIAIGPILKPSRVHEKFQCVVVIKKSDIHETPPPFLNRFEKYYINHEVLLNVVLRNLQPALRFLLETSRQKAEEFIQTMERSSSFYGLQDETLNSLLLTFLPSVKCKYVSRAISTRTDTDCKDTGVLLLKFLLEELNHNANFSIPEISADQLALDAKNVFELVNSDQEMKCCFKKLNREEIQRAVYEALDKLYDPNCLAQEEDITDLSLGASMVVCVLQQWFIRYLCRSIMKLMTPEALIYHRMKIPSSYLEDYLIHQHHFNLKDLITSHVDLLNCEQAKRNGGANPTKLLCFTRSSPLIHRLPATHPPSSLTQSSSSSNYRHLLENVVYAEKDELMVCRLSSLHSQNSVEEVLKRFAQSNYSQSLTKSKPYQVLLFIVNMQETSQRMVNHLRILIEGTERDYPNIKKLFVVLLHYPPSMLSNACYPSLFLRGWSHYYMDAIGHNPDDAIVNISDWLHVCCFGSTSQLPAIALDTILKSPETLAIVTSWTPFPIRENGLFNKQMTPARRSQALLDIFNDKDVAAVICELFQSYWRPDVKAAYLQRAAVFTYRKESTLNITDSLVTEFRSKFLDFVVYIIVEMNVDFGIDIIFSVNVHPNLKQLYIDILRLTSLPELSQLRTVCASLSEPKVTLGAGKVFVPTFPFFRRVSSLMEEIVEQSREELSRKTDLIREQDEFVQPYHDKSTLLTKMHEIVEARIGALFESDHKECVSVAVNAMSSDVVWQSYFSDFINQKLHIVCDRPGPDELQMSTEVLMAYFKSAMEDRSVLSRLVHLHIRVEVDELDLCKLSSMLRTLNTITETALSAKLPSSPDSSVHLVHSFLKSVQESGNVTGTTQDFTSFVINSLFNAMLGGLATATNASNLDSLKLWYKAYHDVVSMQLVREYLHFISHSSFNQAKFNIMQSLYVLLKSEPLEHEVDMQRACEIIEPFLQQYFTEEYQLKHKCPQLEDIATHIFKTLKEDEFEAEKMRSITEGLLSHFFPPHMEQPYGLDNFQWLLRTINQHTQWMVKVRKHRTPCNVQSGNCTSVYILKKFLLRILGSFESRKPSGRWDSGPLSIYRPEPRAKVGEVLNSDTSLGVPGPYTPWFYSKPSQDLNALMEQPLAHVYFLALLQTLIIKGYSLRELSFASDRVSKCLDDKSQNGGEIILLYIEKQAVLQTLLMYLAKDLDPDDSDALNLLFATVPLESLNRFIHDESTGGNHGMILTLHLLREFQSFHKVFQLLVEKHDVISTGITCLEPVHAKLKDIPVARLYCLHLIMIGEDNSDLSMLYDCIYKEMWNVERSGGRDYQGFVDITKEYVCAEDAESLAGDLGERIVVRKKNQYLMTFWMCTYFGFFDKKESSKALANVIEEHLSDVFEPEYIHLIKFFLLPPETAVSEEPDPPLDPLCQMFYQSRDSKLDTSYQDLTTKMCHAAAVAAAAVLGSPAGSNPLWFYLFAADKLQHTPTTNLTVLPFKQDEVQKNSGYWRTILNDGTISLQSHGIMLWASYSSLCMALLTQPGAEEKISTILDPGELSLRQYCFSQLHGFWRSLHEVLCVSDEHQSFLVMSCLKRLYEAGNQQPQPQYLHGRFRTSQQLQCYEHFWHQDIFLPSWLRLKEEFLDYTQLSKCDVFLELRELDEYFPEFPTEVTLIRNLMASPTALTPSNHLYLLSTLVLNRQRLAIGGILLPKLIEFYHWLHSHLEYQLTNQQAQDLSVGQVVEVVAKHCSRSMREYLLALYEQVKDGYNKYIQLCTDGILAPSEQITALPELRDETTIKDLLSYSDSDNQISGRCGFLYDLIYHLIAFHNHLVGNLKAVLRNEESHELQHFLPYTDVPVIHATEVFETTALVREFPCRHGMSYLMQLVCGRCMLLGGETVDEHTPYLVSRSILDLQTAPVFDLHKLQEDVVQEYIIGKPLIEQLPLMTFKFRDSLSADSLRSRFIGSALDLAPILRKLPIEYKCETGSCNKQLEVEFHSSTVHELHEIVIGLRTVAGHVIKTVLDRRYQMNPQKRDLDSLSILEFLSTLYAPSMDDGDSSLEMIGIKSTHFKRSQLSCVEKLKLQHLYKSLELFVGWIMDGFYDFRHVPYAMKIKLSEEERRQISEIPDNYKDQKVLLDELKFFSEALSQSEALLTCKGSDDGKFWHITDKPILDCVTVPDKCKQLVSHIPKPLTMKNYVALQMELRRLRAQIKDKIQPDPILESLHIQHWNEYVIDKLVKKFARKRASTLPQASRGDYGFPAGDRVVPTLQSDLAKLADSNRHVDSAATTPGTEDWREVQHELQHPQIPKETGGQQVSTTAEELGGGDFIDVTEYLMNVEPLQIYNLGVVLGLSQPRVKGWLDSHSSTFLDDVITAWLQREDMVYKKGVPTWKTLVKALQHQRVSLVNVANEIVKDKGIC